MTIIITLAYLDAGTAGIIIQIIIAAVATGGFTIKLFWRKIIARVRKMSQRNKNQNEIKQ
jgi:hypothetical protein